MSSATGPTLYRRRALVWEDVVEDSAVGRMLTPEDIDGERQGEPKALARLSLRLLAVEMALGGCFMLALLGSGLSGAWKGWALAWTSRPGLVVAAYFLLFYVTYTLLMSPLEYYGGFRLPHSYGLSNQTLRDWLSGEVQGGLVCLGLGGGGGGGGFFSVGAQ